MPRPAARRLVGGVLVTAASAFTLGVGLATPASAAASSVTATPAQPFYKAGATATINVSTTGTPSHLDYSIISGPDAFSQPTAGMPCQSNTVCQFTNNGNRGADQVRVFDDLDNSGTYNSGEPNDVATVTFTGPPNSIGLSTTGSSIPVDNCKMYTASATDVSGNPSVGYNLNIIATQTVTNSATPLSFCNPAGGSSSTANGVNTATETLTTDKNGQATFGVESAQAGTVKVKVQSADNSAVASTSSFTVTGGKTGNDAVTSLAADPTAGGASTHGSVNFAVTATDSNGDPVGAATIQYEITSGPDKTGAGVYPSCGTTAQASGSATCTISNGGTAGQDAITFFVNQDLQNQQTPGPDPGEPTANATATFAAQPAYDMITLTCNDPSNGNAPSSSCQVPVGTASVPLTVTVQEKNANGVEKPVSGAEVNFTVGSGAQVAPQHATTDSNGQATTVLTPQNTSNGAVYRVSAIVGNGSSYNGSGSSSATATVTYAASKAQAPTLAPHTQTQSVGGSATVIATVLDQYGAPVKNDLITFSISGRNSSQTQNVRTDSNGQAGFTYSDNPANPNQSTDNITAVDQNSGLASPNPAIVHWITGSTTPAKVVVDLAGCSTTNPTTSDPNATVSATQYADEACATVLNSANQPLTGDPVVFSVDKGFVGSVNTPANKAAQAGNTTLTTTTDDNGEAFVELGSTAAGRQNLSATSGSATGKASVTYAPGDVVTTTITPTNVTFNSGDTQKFVVRTSDQFDNPVPQEEIDFTQSGPGVLSNSYAVTGADGTAAVNLVTQSGDSGSGSVTGSDVYGTCGYNQTDVCSATATYTVQNAVVPASINVSASSGTVAGGAENVTATVTNSDGTPAANQLVTFTVSGANSASGSATTDSSGDASFSYAAQNAGTDTIKAESGNLSDSTTADIAKATTSVGLRLRPRFVFRGHRVRATVSLANTAGTDPSGRIRLFRITPNGRLFIKGAPVSPGSNTVLFFRPRSVGRLQYVAHYTGDATYQGADSPVRVIRSHRG